MSIPISQLTTGIPNGDVELPGTNPLDTTSSLNGTTFKYLLVDVLQYILNAQGFTTYNSCIAATTLNLNATYNNGTAGVGATLTNAGAQAPLTLDGVNLATGDRVLVKNQSSTFQNGIYVVTTVGTLSTNWVLTRATDYNQPGEIIYLGVVAITQGASQAGLVFQESSQGPFVIGTSPITFQQLQIDITLLPSASPANKILRSDGTYWVQSTNASLDSADKLYDLSELQVDNININGNTISSSDVGGNIVITPNTVGSIVLDGLNWPQVDGTANQALVTNGAGQLSWASFGAPFTPAALTSVSDSNVTITLGGTPLTALLQATSITMGWSGLLPISRGGTNTSTLGSAGQLAQSDGTKYAWTTATYPATATATGTILRADGTNWVATTATYPATTTINQILYSSANNTISEITAGNGSVLVSDAAGVPSMLANPADNYRVLMSQNAAIPVWSTAAYPLSATSANKLLRADGTDWVASTNTELTSTDELSGLAKLNVDNLELNGNTISSTDTNGDLVLTPNGTGDLVLDGLNWPQADGTAGQAVTTNGSGQLGWSTVSTVTVPTVDQRVARFNGTGGAIEDSLVSIDDTGIMSGATQLNVDNLRLDGNIISSTNTNGNIQLIPNGTGQVEINDPGLETGGILVDGAAFETAFRVNDIGGADPAQMILHRHSTTWEPIILSARSNSNTSAHATVTAGMPVLNIYGTGWLNSYYGTMASITFSADTTGTLADGSAPGRLQFNVTPDGALLPVTAMTIVNNGNVSFAANIVAGTWQATTIAVGYGGTGITSTPTNGQLLIGNGSGYTLSTLTAGSGISIANAAGSITISGTGSGIGWTEVTGTTQSMTADNGYVANNAAQVVFTLPTTAAFGTVVNVVGKGAGGWKIAQNAGQNIQLGSTSSTVGVTGYIESTNRYDSIELLCTTANTTWTVLGGPQGNITVS